MVHFLVRNDYFIWAQGADKQEANFMTGIYLTAVTLLKNVYKKSECSKVLKSRTVLDSCTLPSIPDLGAI